MWRDTVKKTTKLEAKCVFKETSYIMKYEQQT
jgi:hypothetical protein